MRKIFFQDWGMLPYEEAFIRQKDYFETTKSLKVANREAEQPVETKSYLFFVSHPHVYTMGKNGSLSNLLWNEKKLLEKGISFYRTNRGGDATYHGPGQIVAYPILDLDHFFGDIHLYMRKLEETVIRVLATYGISAERSEGETGVWLDVGSPKARKICAMGVHTSRWVTMHGLALNVNVDISYYQGIIPCGISDKGVTSMHLELNRTVDENEVKRRLLHEFSGVFDAAIRPLRSD